MNPTKDFTLTLNYEAETERKGKDRLGFHDKFQEPFYLSPDKWEVGLLKTFIPNTRLIPMPRLRFEVKHVLQLEAAYGASTNIHKFEIPSQITYSIDQYLSDVNKNVAIIIHQREHVNETDIKFELKCENGKIIIPEFKFLKDSRGQTSTIKFFDLDTWKKLGFLNIGSENVFYDTPFSANLQCIMGSNTTTIALSAPNLIESQLFGDTYKPVLELFPYHFSRENVEVEFSFRTPSYKRLIGGYISEIYLELEDLDEKIISIPETYYQFVLHFRPCHSTIKML